MRNRVRPNFQWIYPYAESKQGFLPRIPVKVIQAFSESLDIISVEHVKGMLPYRMHVGRWEVDGKMMVCVRMRWFVPGQGAMKRLIHRDREHFQIMPNVADFDS